uniref:Calpain 9 n=1 Tax=Malurus cyaneus samueli TaxID=2593467 RepID=A0A8C5TAL8_9PASS
HLPTKAALPQVRPGCSPAGDNQQAYEELKQECLHNGVLFEDSNFPACNSSLFFSENPPIPFVWKRPGVSMLLCSFLPSYPKFILGGTARTDICQGDLGDCWLLAAIASLTLNEKTLARVVPLDQNFGPDYAGIFHFFGSTNAWLDVVIDDRLPTFKGRLVFLCSAELNEFWSALLEKAYANKVPLLNGSYESLKGGTTIEAMEDFTGGIGEMYDVKAAPDNFYEILEKALKRSSVVGCSIDVSKKSGLNSQCPQLWGSMFSSLCFTFSPDETFYQGHQVQLIRIRNPGDRMKFEDFKVYFDKVEICNLTPDALEDSTAHKWEVTIHQGSWVRGSTAGGCRNFLGKYM